MLDALKREESCGAHFREEHQTEQGEAKRDDKNFSHIAAWEFQEGEAPKLHEEKLEFNSMNPKERDYK